MSLEEEPTVRTFQLRLRRRTASGWTTADPVLNPGEPGLEKDTGRFKIGNGVSKWSELPYFIPISGDTVGGSTLVEHIASDLPHPVYDDGPSFTLLYENAKV